MAVPGASDVGPGEYNPPPAACEPQITSNRPTCATIKFGEGYKPGQSGNRFDFSEPSPGYVTTSYNFVYLCFFLRYVACSVALVTLSLTRIVLLRVNELLPIISFAYILYITDLVRMYCPAGWQLSPKVLLIRTLLQHRLAVEINSVVRGNLLCIGEVKYRKKQ